MEVKVIEIRDSGTFIPAMAILLRSDNTEENYLIRRAGYTADRNYVLLSRIEGDRITYDPYDWGPSRTMRQAHLYVQDHFDEILPGEVIDIEYILKEKSQKKLSERLTNRF